MKINTPKWLRSILIIILQFMLKKDKKNSDYDIANRCLFIAIAYVSISFVSLLAYDTLTDGSLVNFSFWLIPIISFVPYLIISLGGLALSFFLEEKGR